MCISDARGHDQSIVIRMHHDESAYEACAHAPTCRPSMFELAGAGLKLDARCLREILTQKVRGSRLDRLAILYHGLDAVSLYRARESFAFTFLAAQYRQRKEVARKRLIDAKHFHRLYFRLLACFVGGVTFLPQELGGA